MMNFITFLFKTYGGEILSFFLVVYLISQSFIFVIKKVGDDINKAIEWINENIFIRLIGTRENKTVGLLITFHYIFLTTMCLLFLKIPDGEGKFNVKYSVAIMLTLHFWVLINVLADIISLMYTRNRIEDFIGNIENKKHNILLKDLLVGVFCCYAVGIARPYPKSLNKIWW